MKDQIRDFIRDKLPLTLIVIWCTVTVIALIVSADITREYPKWLTHYVCAPVAIGNMLFIIASGIRASFHRKN